MKRGDKMKLHIINSKKYKSNDLEISDWFAQQEEFYNQFRSEVEIQAESEKAFMIKLVKSGEVHWVPRSVCKVVERKEKMLFEF